MTDPEVAAHYGRHDLEARFFEALRGAGIDETALSCEMLATVDEFHVRGLEATLELGAAMDLAPGMRVLDIGSGIGGASRRLAEGYDLQVTGIDLTPAYCRLAERLAVLLGLADRVAYHTADALALPFEDASFDAAFTIHVAMNIEDKAGFYREAARVLKPGARFGIYDLLAGPGGDVVFPVPWAREPASSHLEPLPRIEALLEEAGFRVESTADRLEEGRAWYRKVNARITRSGAPPLTFQVIIGDDFPTMAQNMSLGLDEARFVPTLIIARKR